MNLNLTQMAQDEVAFRFESDEDRKEFWELYIENGGSTEYGRNLFNLASTNIIKLFRYQGTKEITYIDIYRDGLLTWTQIKGLYNMNKDVNIADKIIKELSNEYGFKTINKIEEAISLLQSHGYKVEAPYTDPTDEEICERVKAENEKAGYVVDWKDEYGNKYFINYDHTEKSYEYSSRRSYEMIGLVYTTKQIAETIVDELNEGRFVRV